LSGFDGGRRYWKYSLKVNGHGQMDRARPFRLVIIVTIVLGTIALELAQLGIGRHSNGM
jgi:hypothetical protein